MIIETGSFGPLNIGNEEIIHIPQGILGFQELKKYCLVDPGDDTLILWLQSLEKPQVAFPVLEPKIYKADYIVKLAGADLRELKLENLGRAAVFNILTIPDDVSKMTANLKAPIVINIREQLAKQVVLQENDYEIKHNMFKELRTQLMTIRAQQDSAKAQLLDQEKTSSVISVPSIPVSPAVRAI